MEFSKTKNTKVVDLNNDFFKEKGILFMHLLSYIIKSLYRLLLFLHGSESNPKKSRN